MDNWIPIFQNARCNGGYGLVSCLFLEHPEGRGGGRRVRRTLFIRPPNDSYVLQLFPDHHGDEDTGDFGCRSPFLGDGFGCVREFCSYFINKWYIHNYYIYIFHHVYRPFIISDINYWTIALTQLNRWWTENGAKIFAHLFTYYSIIHQFRFLYELIYDWLWLYVWYNIGCIYLGLWTAGQAWESCIRVWSWLDLGSCVNQGVDTFNEQLKHCLPSLVSLSQQEFMNSTKQMNSIWKSKSTSLWIKHCHCDIQSFHKIQT